MQAQSPPESLAATIFGVYIHADCSEQTTEGAPQVARSRLVQKLAQSALLRANRSWPAMRSRGWFFFRTTTRRVTVDGATIPAGEKVMVFIGSADRDPRKWDRPDECDITRNTVGHAAGVQLCVGVLLARIEGESLLSALARK